MKKCKYCKTEIDKKAIICPNCKKKQNNPIKIIVAIFIIIVGFCIIAVNLENEENVDFDTYTLLNPQELHNDYISNEISAEDKYYGNYYYFTGKIYKVEKFLNDTYLEIQYRYDKDTSKIIELDAYFENENDIKSVNAGDEVTVYCKFNQRSIENYMGIITTYSLKKCKFKN